MPEGDCDVLLDRAARDTEFGRDVGMGYPVDAVAPEHPHGPFRWAGQGRRQSVEAVTAGNRVKSGGSVVDRFRADDRRRRIDIAGIAALATTVRTDAIEHDVHADAVQIRERVRDRSGRVSRRRLRGMKPDLLHDVFGFRDAARTSGEEPDELGTIGR